MSLRAMTNAADAPFTPDQQEYLKGFMAGVEARRAVSGQPLAPVAGVADPADPHRAAQDRAIAAGGKLTAEEEAKRRKHPLDRFDEVAAMAAEPRFPKGTVAENAADLWRWLQDGAHFYVCGDANRMARDVDAALRRIAVDEGRLDAAQARDWIAALARQDRYQRDIY